MVWLNSQQRLSAQLGQNVDALLSTATYAVRVEAANKRPRFTPPSLGRSLAWLANRRRDPTPINTGARPGRRVELCGEGWLLETRLPRSKVEAVSGQGGLAPSFLALDQPVDFLAQRVLQTAQKCPETAGSKSNGIAKQGERFQRVSPKAVVLPLHHSPKDY